MSSGLSIVTYALLKKATSAEIKKAIEDLSEGMTFRGAVQTVEDLPSSGNAGDLYIVKDPGMKVVWDGEWVEFDHELKVADKSLAIKNHKINVELSKELGNNLRLNSDGLYVPVEGSIGINFTTDIAVGHLKAGTVIKETDTVADILYRMLYTPSEEMIDFYYGAADDVPVDVNNLTKITKNVSEILARRFTQNVKTGNKSTGVGQYPVFAIAKRETNPQIILKQWSVAGAELIPLDFLTVEGDDDYIYYIGTKTYDEDLGGTNYILTFDEEE